MRTVIIRRTASPDDQVGVDVQLGPGEQATFGRGCPSVEVDVVLPDPAVARLAGRITATGDHWLVTNLSASTTYVVENPEGGGEFIRVAPRRVDAPVPFEFSRLVIPGSQAPVSFDVLAPEHTYADEVGSPTGPTTLASFSLDESAKYFLVLVSLCEPRLRDAVSPVLPTVPDIVERLRPLPSCHDLTRRAVSFHIDYLATVKLRVKRRRSAIVPPDGPAPKADWQRASLVTTAVKFGLVTEHHLRLLPPRARSPWGRAPDPGS